jgi:hypothetical protein
LVTFWCCSMASNTTKRFKSKDLISIWWILCIHKINWTNDRSIHRLLDINQLANAFGLTKNGDETCITP